MAMEPELGTQMGRLNATMSDLGNSKRNSFNASRLTRWMRGDDNLGRFDIVFTWWFLVH
jgi:hypothetical protein